MLLATPEDMRASFGHEEYYALVQRHAYADAPPDGEPDEAAALAVMQKALADASDTAASYLTARYPVFANTDAPQGFVTPKSLVRAVCDIGRYYLVGAGTFLTDAIETRYKLAIAWLKDVAAGKADLPLPPDDSGAQSGGSVVFSTGTRQWAQSSETEADEW